MSRAILRAAEHGIVTSTSVLAVAPAFAATAPWLRDAGLGVGAHLAAVGEDPPVLSAARDPDARRPPRRRFARRGGSSCRGWRPGASTRTTCGESSPLSWRASPTQSLPLTHVDTHQHVHLWPSIGRVVLAVAADAGISAVRIIRSSSRLAGRRARCRGSPVGSSAGRRRRASGTRLTATGLDEAGRLGDAPAGRRRSSDWAPRARRRPSWPPIPGEADDADLARYQWGYEWGDELAALTSPTARDAVARAGFRLGTYADLETRTLNGIPFHERNSVQELVRAAYRNAPRADRLHVAGRLRSCPFDAVVDRVPAAGRVLDVGCGHGLLSLLLAAGSPERAVLGTDVDRGKIDVARAAAAEAGLDNVTFEVVAPGSVPQGSFAAVCVVDMLYLLGRPAAELLLSGLAANVAHGGAILVKEIDVRPRWKFRLAHAQELVSTRVLRITDGAAVTFVPPDAIGAVLLGAGMAVEHVPLHHRRLHPHHLVIGRRL